uniref:TRF2/HOY1 PH-like domain-containing protein n=1 Tax=Spongospora subterranea TaxID=70186 RepID=A0A0H5RLZ9_9EUKA|eukprot:CRZ09759.1 hypothetical protein [Spongospora subterranea]
MVVPAAKANAKFKPARLKCSRLKIGTWSFTAAPSNDRMAFEAKFLFSRKRLVWEWKIGTNSKKKIDIPFASVDQMYGENVSNNQCRLIVVVTNTPNFSSGVIANNQATKWGACEDFTDGQALKSALHELDLPVDIKALNTVLATLGDFDPNFREMFARRSQLVKQTQAAPVSLEPLNKKPRPSAEMFAHAVGQAQAHSERNSIAHVERKPVLSTSGCTCVGICEAFTCSCSLSLRKCNPQTCVCLRACCQNPFSIMAAKGLNLDRLPAHQCLNDNISLHPERQSHRRLFSRITLPCCKAETLLVHSLALGSKCACGATWDFSFCEGKPVDFGGISETFHCSKCKRCQSIDSKHCDICGVCSSTESPCPCAKLKIPSPVVQCSSGNGFQENGHHPCGFSPSDIQPSESPDSDASLASTMSPPKRKTPDDSLAGQSHWSRAFLGLGQDRQFHRELQQMVQDLYR